MESKKGKRKAKEAHQSAANMSITPQTASSPPPKGKQKHEDEEMVVPGNEGGSDMKNTCNSNQTSIPDCETQKQEIAPKEGDKRSPHASSLLLLKPHGSSSGSYSFKQCQRGLCGLVNLGNTCFMNSALQCLSNTQPLTEYFFDDYQKHINRNNRPLGTDGAIAEAYGALIKEMWSGQVNHVLPHRMKAEVQKYAPQFMGYSQQDAQELLTFLLTGIHEDLNLVKDKPYFEMTVNTEGKDTAEESWYNYLRRNQSVIVKVFQGQLKTTLDCPQCRKKTWVFDPFTFLSLPLPTTKETRRVSVTLIRTEQPKHPLQIETYKVTIPKEGIITDLKKELSKLTRIGLNMMMIDVPDSQNQRHQIVRDDDYLSYIPEIGTFVHELSHPITDEDWVHVPVHHRLSEGCTPFGIPVVVSIQKQQCTDNHFYEAILDKCRKYMKEWPEKEETRTSEKSNEPEDTGIDAEENEMSRNGEQKTDLFEMEVIDGDFIWDFDELKQIYQPIASNAHIYCKWSPEVKEKYYDTKTLTKSFKEHESCADKEQGRRSGISLSDCLDLFAEEKTVGIGNAWYCPDCKQPVQVSKKSDLWKLPEILIVYLKRFCYNRFGLKKKVDAMVDYPMSNLSLKSYDHGQDHVYDLFATINHVGGLIGGHYTACCRNFRTERWYTFDDTCISEVKTGRIVSAKAYVLFYQRRSEGHKVNNGLLADRFAEEMHHLEAKFKPCDTDKEQEEATNQEENKEEMREESK